MKQDQIVQKITQNITKCVYGYEGKDVEELLTDEYKLLNLGDARKAASVISAYFLIKVNKIDNQDRIRRSLWAVEKYLLSVGKYIGNQSNSNLEEYQSRYVLYRVYAHEELRRELEEIDHFLNIKDMNSAKSEVGKLTEKYSKIYKMDRFSPRKRIRL